MESFLHPVLLLPFPGDRQLLPRQNPLLRLFIPHNSSQFAYTSSDTEGIANEPFLKSVFPVSKL